MGKIPLELLFYAFISTSGWPVDDRNIYPPRDDFQALPCFVIHPCDQNTNDGGGA